MQALLLQTLLELAPDGQPVAGGPRGHPGGPRGPEGGGALPRGRGGGVVLLRELTVLRGAVGGPGAPARLELACDDAGRWTVRLLSQPVE